MRLPRVVVRSFAFARLKCPFAWRIVARLSYARDVSSVVGRMGRRSAWVAIAIGLTTTPAHAGDRPKQDYGSPPEAAPSPATLVGKVLFFPLYLVAEYVLRQPIGWLFRTGEKLHLPLDASDSTGDDGIGIVPWVSIDSEKLPLVGFDAHWRHIASSRHSARLHLGTWGIGQTEIIAADRIELSKHEDLVIRGRLRRARDNPYFGIGPQSSPDSEVRYATAEAGAELAYESEIRQGAKIDMASGIRSLGFRFGGCCDASPLGDAIAAGKLAPPPGFGNGYTALYDRIAFAVDTSRARPQPGDEFRFEAHATPSFVVDHREGRRAWLSYGASATGALDLTNERRVLSLTVAADFVDPLVGTVPFTDQVALGGGVMRGFVPGRLVDRSAAVTTLAYSWPIWPLLDGVADVAVGNVFGSHLADLDPARARLSTGLGVRTSARHGTFEAFVAIGTEPFDQGLPVSSLRFFIGGHDLP